MIVPEANTIRGKCLMIGNPRLGPTAAEVMLLIGHFDLVDMRLRAALETLSGCLPPKIYVYGDEGQLWSADEPDVDEFEEIDFKEVLGEAE